MMSALVPIAEKRELTYLGSRSLLACGLGLGLYRFDRLGSDSRRTTRFSGRRVGGFLLLGRHSCEWSGG